MLCTLFGALGHVVCAFNSGLSGPGLSSGQGHCVVFLVLLSTQVYKCVPANCESELFKFFWGSLCSLRLENVLLENEQNERFLE